MVKLEYTLQSIFVKALLIFLLIISQGIDIKAREAPDFEKSKYRKSNYKEMQLARDEHLKKIIPVEIKVIPWRGYEYTLPPLNNKRYKRKRRFKKYSRSEW